MVSTVGTFYTVVIYLFKVKNARWRCGKSYEICFKVNNTDTRKLPRNRKIPFFSNICWPKTSANEFTCLWSISGNIFKSYRFCKISIKGLASLKKLERKRKIINENWTMNNVLLKRFLKFLWKHLCQSLFLTKLQLGSLQLHWKQDCGTAVFLWFLRTLILHLYI